MTSRGSISAWCIDRPVATLLLTFALVLLGGLLSLTCLSPHCRKPNFRRFR